MPTDVLPFEILGKVFEHALPIWLNAESHTVLLTMCLVCKDWRDAAYLNHSLWSKIYIDHPANQYLPYQKVLLWHSRSGGFPRSLEYMATCLVNPGLCDFRRCDSPNPVLARILQYSQRINHLKISCRGPQCIRSLQQSMASMDHSSNSSQQQPPRLSFEQLSIDSLALHWSHLRDKTHPVPLPPISSFQLDILDDGVLGIDFEHVYDALLNSVGRVRPRRTLSPTVLQGLTSLVLNSNWNVDDLSEALCACSNLLNLTLELRAHRSYLPTTDAMKRGGIALPKLQSLALRQLSSKSLPILDILRMHPGILRKLDLTFESPDLRVFLNLDEAFSRPTTLANTILSPWFPFISKHAETLETLSIRDANPWNDPALKDLVSIDTLYNIRHLSVDGIVPRSSIFSEDSGPSFPHLASLSLLNMDDTFAVDEVLEFLKRRRPYHVVEGKPVFEGPPDTIKRVTVAYRGLSSYSPHYGASVEYSVEPHSEDTLAKVGALIRGGMDVEIGPIYRPSSK